MIDYSKPVAALFDLDGVVFNTEPQYTEFWKKIGETFLPDIPDFAQKIKGTTLKEILATYFAHIPGADEKVRDAINRFEEQMTYPLVPGVLDRLLDLRMTGFKTAIVTSSDKNKMANVFKADPGIRIYFDKVFTAEDFKFSKPDPYCYLYAMEQFNTVPGNCVVFEDSFNGLEAGRRAGMFVVGLATTNPAKAIKDKADMVIDNFMWLDVENLVSRLGR